MPKKLEARGVLLFIGAMLSVLFLFSGQPQFAAAATDFSNGSLVKGVPSAVYFVTADGKRMAFPNETTYFSWYSDFSTVKTISDEALAALPLSSLVTLKPGLSAVRVESDKAIYAVAHGGILRKISSPGLAAMIFGSDWDNKATIVPDAFFSSYKMGDEVTGAGQYWWKQEKNKSPDISSDRDMAPVSSVAVAPKTVSDDTNKVIFQADVLINQTDEQSKPAPDIRYFHAVFSKLAKNVTIAIAEKVSGTVVISKPMLTMPPTKTYFQYWSPKLNPGVTYTWKISANEETDAVGVKPYETTGEFTIANLNDIGITKVSIFKYDDGKGANGEDARGFHILFSDLPKNASVSLNEKDSGTLVGTETADDNTAGSKVFDTIPDNWTVKLKPKTAYAWKVTANFASPSGADTIDEKTGEFTTSDFSVSGNAAVAMAQPGEFAINSVIVEKVNAKGEPAEDTRSFTVNFSAKPADGTVSIMEKNTGREVSSFTLSSGGELKTTMRLHPYESDDRLKPGTLYIWIITAIDGSEKNALFADLESRGLVSLYVGEFTTAAKF